METTIEILKEDIIDAKIVKRQAYNTLVEAEEWYQSRCHRLNLLEAELEKIEKSN